ncbi:unnamed protein product [Orchesella dallaii]|uniref:Uncharacterized protein n=1 Tax=Orchesella dallaii TaxID=48710 RepID=A0ABP1QE89_9HEXA
MPISSRKETSYSKITGSNYKFFLHVTTLTIFASLCTSASGTWSLQLGPETAPVKGVSDSATAAVPLDTFFLTSDLTQSIFSTLGIDEDLDHYATYFGVLPLVAVVIGIFAFPVTAAMLTIFLSAKLFLPAVDNGDDS